jgi:CelD/BcsL family acetyltransferase involved in cellulose biosynthesis
MTSTSGIAMDTSGDFMDPRLLVDSASLGYARGRSDGLDLEILDPCTQSSWDREALAHPDATLFHSSAWARVLVRTYRHRPQYCRFSRHGELLALVPLMEVRSPFSGNRGVSLPFTDFCEPLIFPGPTPPPLSENLAALAHQRKWRHFEIRGTQVAPPSAIPAVAFHGHSVDVSSGRDLFASFAPAVRRAIRKAERSALEVRIVRTREAMLEFYRLHVHTRRRHGLPPQPVSFFLNIHEQMMEADLGFISLVQSGSIPVAAAVFFHHGTTAIYKFGASDRAFQALRPNNLAFWHAMKFLAGTGAQVLHLGRTSLQNESLRQFKLGWGASETPIQYFKFNTGTEAWTRSSDQVSGFHNALFSKMPLFVNRLMGTLIYPHLD